MFLLCDYSSLLLLFCFSISHNPFRFYLFLHVLQYYVILMLFILVFVATLFLCFCDVLRCSGILCNVQLVVAICCYLFLLSFTFCCFKKNAMLLLFFRFSAIFWDSLRLFWIVVWLSACFVCCDVFAMSCKVFATHCDFLLLLAMLLRCLWCFEMFCDSLWLLCVFLR